MLIGEIRPKRVDKRVIVERSALHKGIKLSGCLYSACLKMGETIEEKYQIILIAFLGVYRTGENPVNVPRECAELTGGGQ